MGVQGLWQLIQPVGRPVSLQSMEGKILAVDVSLWLHQLAKGMRDKDGEPLPHAHLLGLFNRICKLLFYRIKPIFVFDGGVPPLKKQTLAHRKEKKHNAEKESEKASQKILSNFVKSQILGQALGKPETETKLRPSNSKFDDLFILPPLPKEENGKIGNDIVNTSWEDRLAQQQIIQEEFEDMESLDIESEDFRTMPSEVQYEILTELRLSRRESSWAKLDQFPKESNDFSSYQLKNLLKKGRLSNRLDEVQRDINMRTCGQLAMNIDEAYFNEIFESRRVISEDSSHTILIKGLKDNDQKKISASGLKLAENNMDATNPKPDSEDVNDKSTCEQVDFTSKLVNLTEIYNLNNLQGEKKNASNEIVSIPSSDNDNSQIFHENSDFINENVYNENDKNEKGSKNEIATSIILLERTDDEEIDKNLTKRHHDHFMKDKEPDHIQAKKSKLCDAITKHKAVQEINDVDDDLDNSSNYIDISDNSDDDFVEVSNIPNAFPPQPTNPAESDNVIDVIDDWIWKDPVSTTDPDHLISVTAFDKILVNEKEADVFSTHPASTKSSASEVVSVHRTENIDKSREPIKHSSTVTSNRSKAEDNKSIVVIDSAVNETRNIREDEEAEQVGYPARSPIAQITVEITNETSEVVFKANSNVVNEFAGMSKNDLENLHEDLVMDTRRLQSERSKQDRHAVSITDQMYMEAQELLNLFGIPFVISPMEAEAQCAHLDLTNQVHGTITDDSDVWLFGGKRVYKNFFNLNRHVELYRNTDIMTQFGLDRGKLINIALLCGSDYTDGIHGVGSIKALEIMAEFPGEDMESLVAFRSWWDANINVSHATSTIRSKLKSLAIHPGFPNHVVFNAYKTPMVDTSDEPFSWSLPDLGQLREYASIRFGWSRKKIDDMLLPVLKNLSKAKLQSNITGYFQPEFHMTKDKIKSNRIKTVTDKLLGKSQSSSENRGTMEAKASTSTGGLTTSKAKSFTTKDSIKAKNSLNSTDDKIKNNKNKVSSKTDNKQENENEINIPVFKETSIGEKRPSKAKSKKELPPVKPLPIVDVNEVRKKNAIVIWKKVQKTNTGKRKGKKSTYFKRNVKGEDMMTVEAPSEVNLSESSDSD